VREQGINFYRNDVKTFCQTKTIDGKKKMLVIDDIDTICFPNQQVLRNIIDKYYSNVHFVATCGDRQKVIENLQSRLTTLNINSLNNTHLASILETIVKNENIQLDDETKQFIVNVSSGSVKEMINYLDKIRIIQFDTATQNKLNYNLVISLCSTINHITFKKYTQHMLNGSLKDAIFIIQSICDKGYSVIDILDAYFEFIKTTDLLSEIQKYNIIPYICKYISIFNTLHEDEIELVFFTNNVCKLLMTK